MHDPIAVGRRSVLTAAAVSGMAVVALALGVLFIGTAHACAALLGGGALVAGNALAARLSLSGIVSARHAFARLLLGMGAKWVFVVAAFAIGLGMWRLPPLSMLAGLVVAMLVHIVALQALRGAARSGDNQGGMP